MKVGLLGNMNNNFFALARMLRDSGIDAHVLMFDNEFHHFHPAADTFDLGYQEFCHQLSWGAPLRVMSTRRATIATDLDRYEILIGCAAAPAYCEKVQRRLDVFVPYGGDIYALSMFRFVRPSVLLQSLASVKLQQRGIRSSRVCHMELTNELYERRLQTLRGDAARWTLGFPMVYSRLYNPAEMAERRVGTHWWKQFATIRDQNDLVVFYHARHEWRMPESDPNHKGTDRLLRGFALFTARHPALRAALVTMEYGTNVAESRDLASKLGIASHIRWFPRMLRKDIMAGLTIADVVCAEFTNSWMASGVIYEGLAMARPVLGFREDSLYRDTHGTLYPMLHAREPEEIADRLEEVAGDPDRARALGEAGRVWYQQHVVEATIDKYGGYLAGRESEADLRLQSGLHS